VFPDRLSIDFFSVFDPKDENALSSIVHIIENPVVPAADTVTMRSAEFLRSVWSRVVDKERDTSGNSLNLFWREHVEVVLCRRLNDYFVCHALLGIVVT
jgi:hypothetical protein